MHLPFAILSDEKYKLTKALELPTFEYDGVKLQKRMTLFVEDGEIKNLLYPIFPPDTNAKLVIEMLKNKKAF